MKHLDLRSRRLESSDLAALNAMSLAEGWGYGEIYWKVILSSCIGFGTFDETGMMTGCIFVANYGESRGNIGVLIVSKEHRGKGIASFLMDQAENIIADGHGAVSLVATKDGIPVYKHRGYEVVADCHQMIRWQGASPSPMPNLPGYRFSPITEDNLADILTLDRHSFGADRSHILYALYNAADKTVALIDQETGRCCGFGMLYQRADMMKLGPIVANELDQAVAIVQMLIYGRSDTVRMDVLTHQPEFRERIAEFGFAVDCVDPVMILRGGAEITEKPQLFAIGSQSLG